MVLLLPQKWTPFSSTANQFLHQFHSNPKVGDVGVDKEGSLDILHEKIPYEMSGDDHLGSNRSLDLEYYKCPICTYGTRLKHNLKPHMRKHTGEKPYKCKFCSYSAAQRTSFRVHVMRYHPNDRWFLLKFDNSFTNDTRQTRLIWKVLWITKHVATFFFISFC